MSTSVALVTCASSGFGLIIAHALDQAGCTVFASMPDTAGRNAPQAGVADCIRHEMFRNFGLAALLSPRING